MGFFSKLKKIWKGDAPPVTASPFTTTESPQPQAETVAPIPEPPAQAAPEPVLEPSAPAPVAASPETVDAPWRDALVLALRQAEPRLSIWLDILLTDVTTTGPDLWQRLRFLFECLEAPTGEAEAFVTSFAAWTATMEYEAVEAFRSELQYRLALALDLEDEEDERNRLFLKLSKGLAKTKEQIVRRIDSLLGSHTVIDEAFWEELEEILLMADVGFDPAAKLLESLRSKVRKRGTTDQSWPAAASGPSPSWGRPCPRWSRPAPAGRAPRTASPRVRCPP